MFKLRLPEWVKSLLILLLSLSALWLVRLSPLYVGSPLETWVDQLFSKEEAVPQTTVSLTAAARPLAISIVNSDGRYTAQYDASAVSTAFDAVGTLLGEALVTAGTPFSISEDRWQTALSEPGIYLDLGFSLPFSVLVDWLGGEGSDTPLTTQARRMALACGNNESDVWLFWQDSSSELFYACSTSLNRSLHLLSEVSSWLPDSSFFAFEDEAYSACAPYTLISDTPQLAVYTSATPLSAAHSAAVKQVLDTLSYSVASGSSYAISGGTRYTDGTNTFQLTDTGVLTYHASDPSHFPVSTSHETATLTECIEATRQLVQNTLGQFCGSAQLCLSELELEGNSLTLTYQYRLNGVPVALRQEGWAAQFTITDGTITAFTLHFRSYSPSDDVTLLLPELQAAAAMSALNAEGCELSMTYLDSGALSTSAGWFAR